MAHTVFIRGIPDNPSIVDVRVWTNPGMDSTVVFRAKVNTTAITDRIAPDDRNTAFAGQVYRWFHLLFPDGRTGWVRDDLLDIQGDFTPFGYANYARRTFAFVAAQSVPLVNIKTPGTVPAGIVNNNPPPPPPDPTTTRTKPPTTQIVVIAPNTNTAPATPMICIGQVLPTVQPTIRKQPAGNAESAGDLPPNTPVQIFGVTAMADGDGVRWVQVVGGGFTGYVRSDVLVYAPECAEIGLPIPTQATVPIVPPTRQPVCTGNARLDLQPNIRNAASFNATKVGMLQPGAAVNIFSVVSGQDGDGFRWVEISAQGVSGFVREDLLTYAAGCNVLGLSASQPPVNIPPVTLNTGGKFPSPVPKVVITQEFGANGHKGTDFGVRVGTVVKASGDGTAFVVRCQRCRDDAPNFLSQGINKDVDPAKFKQALNDPAWGFGFGNAVMVRYVWEALPPDMRTLMTQKGLTNGAVYVIHGHFSRIDVNNGQTVSNGTQLGLSGDTGNSEGAHLHLEVRLSADAKATTLEGIFGKLVENPRSMYSF